MTKKWMGFFLLLAATLLAFRYRESLDPTQLESWIESWGPVGMLWFVGLYTLSTVLFLPGSLLTLAGGALFGPWLGGLLSLLGATMGAGCAFLIARYLAGGWVQQRADGMAKRLLSGVEAEGWLFVAFVRLVPLFPFNLLNYALGLTRIHFGHYLLTSLLCMAPGGLAYAWLGHAGREAATGSRAALQAGLWAVGLLAVAIAIPRWVRRANMAKSHLTIQQLHTLQASDQPLAILDVRDAADFTGENGHIPGAFNIPLAELTRRLAEVEQINRPLAIICYTDRRSAVAFKTLHAQGIRPLFLVLGGMKQWRQAGFAVEQ